MSEELRTISQIAKELNVSRQTVYNRINNNPDLSSRLCQYTVKQQNRTLYTLQAVELIKQAFDKSVKSNIDVKFTSNIIDTLTQQLTVKDSQITSLQKEVEKLTETIHELTIALKAAQALHGMDKKQAVIEVKEQPPAPARPAATVESRRPRPRPRPQQPPPKKKNLFEKIFGRK